jgi:hypothetical protein
VPGNDDDHFCKPSAVAVMSTGDFFVSDGYCNTRIIKFNRNGKFLMQWGRNSFQGKDVWLRELLTPSVSKLCSLLCSPELVTCSYQSFFVYIHIIVTYNFPAIHKAHRTVVLSLS